MGKKSNSQNNKQQKKQQVNSANNNGKQNKKQSKSESKVEENTFTEEQLKIHRENVVKLTKDLAATDEGFRTRATERFPTFLKETNFNKLDLDTNFIDFRKLWKGALYGFWLCDGEFKQHEMAQLLAECIHQVKGSASSPHELPIAFLRAFFDELFETWPKLDKHRMDKYLMLVRKVMQQTFVFLNKTAHYKPEAVEEFIEFILQDGIYNNEERKLLASLQIHIAELFFLELVQYGGPQVEDDADYHLNEDALMKFIQFFIKDFASTENNSIKKTYREEMFDLLAQYQSIEGEGQPEEEEEEEEPEEENGDAMEDEDDDLPVDEFGNVREIKKDRPLPVNIERIVKEFEKYKTGYENSDVCTEYYEKFKTRIITLDDLYSELEEVETTVTQKEQARNEKKKKQQEKKAQQKANNENKKSQEKKQENKKQTEKKVEETIPQEKKQENKKQKKDNNKAAAAEQKKKEEQEKKMQEKLEQEKKAQLEKEQKEREEQAAEEKKRSQLLNKVKSVKKLLKDKKAPTTSTSNASSDEKQEKKKVIIDLEKNQVKTFNKKDIVPSLPVDLTFSPTKGLLKTKQDKKRSSDSLDNSQRSSKKRK